MKKPLLVSSLLIAALSLATPGMAVADGLPGTLSKVSFNLTVSQVVEGTVAKDATGKPLKKGTAGAGPAFINEYEVSKGGTKVAEVAEFESKTVVKKYTTKNFLDDLVELQVIESVKGWSLVRACGTVLVPVLSEGDPDAVPPVEPALLGNKVTGQDLGYYLVNKEGEAKNVTPYFLFASLALLKDTTSEKMEAPVTDGVPGLFNYSYAAKFKRVGLLMISTTNSQFLSGLLGGLLGGGLGGGFIPAEVEYQDIDVNAYVGVGVATGSEKVGTFGADDLPIFLPGATKVDVSLGANIDIFVSAADQESGVADELGTLMQGISLIEGSVSLSAGKPMADVSTLPPLPVSEVTPDM